MNFNNTLEKLEADGEILKFKYNKSQIPMYLFIRFYLIQSLINKKFDLTNPHVKMNKKSLKRILLYIYYTFKLNLFFSPKKDIYIFSSGIVNKLENKKYTNRLYDDFYQLFKSETQIVESSTQRSYLLPKKEKIYFRDLVDIIIFLISKFVKLNRNDLNQIENFINYLKNKKLFEDIALDDIKNALIKTNKKMSISFWMYKQFLKIKKPKLIIIEDAHYFGHMALLLEAKKLGIKTAEYQHGYIGLAHPAYNFHCNILEDIREYLPEYFLTHGDYWSSVSRTPAKKISIGLPSLSKKIDDEVRGVNAEQKKILFISGGTTYKELNKLISASLVSLKNIGYTILLRPHPLEFSAIKARYLNLIEQGVEIDNSSLYDVLQKVDVVVGMEVSTVLYEAVCFTKKVYLMKTEYTKFYEPQTVFMPFVDEDELMSSIAMAEILKCKPEYFWRSNWKKNYIGFIRGIIK